MRPSILIPLFATITDLPGIGPRLATLFDRLLGDGERPARVMDLLFHAPVGVIDRRGRPTVADATPGEIVTLDVRVARHQPAPPQRARAPYRVVVEDATGDVTLVYFGGSRARMETLLPPGEPRIVSGRIELWEGHRQMVHPDFVLRPDQLGPTMLVEPIYPLTEGLGGRVVVKAMAEALRRIPQLPEWQNPQLLGALPSFGQALQDLHAPESAEALDPASPALRRLALDEILATQLALGLVRQRRRRQQGRPNLGGGQLAARIRAGLPFALTAAQSQALQEIEADLAAPDRMLRLLQGDVGSGKTVVALLAMARVVEGGRQAAFMAPTEILARQHYERLQPLANAAGIEIAVLTGRDRAAERAAVLDGLASGRIKMIVGTHALFQSSVAFQDLGFAVVDEQHRFGVHQRLALGSKGDGVDLLVMTATPIPRTLVLTLFGDLDVSTLAEKPAGRQPIATRVMPLDRLDEVVEAIRRAVAAGARVYWICPLIAAEEDEAAAAAEQRSAALSEALGPVVGLLHGKMAARDKDAAMGRFAAGETQVLVATTVVEVGVDVPEATVMVIEQAERFGLAQLHQLRGRVGRGSGKSSCILLYKSPLGAVAEARLKIMRETEDGFRIAEEDLRLRGQGEILGTKQSGVPDFRFLRADADGGLIAAARAEAEEILQHDPQLRSERGDALKLLLYLFERDEAIRLLRAG